MPVERTTVIVSVNAESDEEARIQQIEAHVGQGWRVVQTLPLEGSTAGPGGAAAHMMRLQATLERTIEPQDGSAIGAIDTGRDR
jgi:hypothetical protein